MIWLDEEFHLDGQPTDHTVRLKGGYASPGSGNDRTSPVIALRLTISNLDDDDHTVVTIFSTSPSMLRYEEPSADDVLAKYNHKVVKACNTIRSMNYAELLDWAKRKNS